MDFSGSHFIYNGISSRKYGLIFANANTERVLSIIGNVESVTVYNKIGKRNYFVGESFEGSSLVFDAEIITDNDSTIDLPVRRSVEQWLFHQPAYRKLYIDAADDCDGETYEMVNGIQKQLYLNCRFVNPEKIEYGSGVIGYKFTVECDSCMAWQDPVTYSFDFDHQSASSSSIITVDVDSDLNDYVYPKVIIQIGDIGGSVTINNNSDNASRLTSFVELPPYATIIMNGSGINYISGDHYQRFSDKNFIRLINGENKLAVIGDVSSLNIEFQNRRYL